MQFRFEWVQEPIQPVGSWANSRPRFPLSACLPGTPTQPHFPPSFNHIPAFLYNILHLYSPEPASPIILSLTSLGPLGGHPTP